MVHNCRVRMPCRRRKTRANRNLSPLSQLQIEFVQIYTKLQLPQQGKYQLTINPSSTIEPTKYKQTIFVHNSDMAISWRRNIRILKQFPTTGLEVEGVHIIYSVTTIIPSEYDETIFPDGSSVKGSLTRPNKIILRSDNRPTRVRMRYRLISISVQSAITGWRRWIIFHITAMF